MRKFTCSLLTAAALLLGSGAATAQTVFAPIGAEWWFEARGLVLPGFYTHMTVPGDTIIGGFTARKMRIDHVESTAPTPTVNYYDTWYVRTAGDSVLRWDAAAAAYKLEFDFGRSVGATWAAPLYCNSVGTVGVEMDSLGSAQLMGGSVRRQFPRVPTAPTAPNAHTEDLRQPITERIGTMWGVGSLIFPAAFCPPGVPEGVDVLIAYTDSQYRFGAAPVLGRREDAALPAISVSPNPSASGRFVVSGLPVGATSYALYDAQGRILRQGQFSAGSAEINLSHLPAGLYVVRSSVNGLGFSRRLIRE